MSTVLDRLAAANQRAERIRVRGLVQGVGFRPTVWRLAQRHGLRGWVANDGAGVDIHACGSSEALDAFAQALVCEAPPLARVDGVERAASEPLPLADFVIRASQAGSVHTGVVPDAASCAACVAEVFDPAQRRYRYPFANCTHCGPRLAIVEGIPYDRATTTMRRFALCADCAAEYGDAADRRFHAQPIACPACGPRAWLEGADAAAGLDAIDAACTLLLRGRIVAVKGLGGFQLACDAGDEAAVARLRARKRRERKPFALMARDLAVVCRHCVASAADAALLASAAAPIVVMDARGDSGIAASVAPGLPTLGVMLPNTPLHHLLLERIERPIVLTSGNLSDEPQCIANDEARIRLGGIADAWLLHDRDIARRVDDSVQRVVAGAPRMLRRARGHAPAPLPLPAGFERAPPLLALGGEAKNAFCLLREGQAIVSHHIGDLASAPTSADYRAAIDGYRRLFACAPRAIAVDLHPQYLSRQLGAELAQAQALALVEVQHHHAHIAACMAENGVAPDAPPLLGVALDGLGWGDDATPWGGEFLRADYRSFTRLGRFEPVALPGGEQAIVEPWRNAYAHLSAALGWPHFEAEHGALELARFLAVKPHAVLDRMIAAGINSPLSSSCGRLFDAVAAALGVCRERASYEGQPAIELEALVDRRALADADDRSAYRFAIAREKTSGLLRIEARPMWRSLLDDLHRGAALPVIAARFHKGLAIAVVRMIGTLAQRERFAAVALSGGVFANRVLLEQVLARLEALPLRVLTHRHVPAGDGGLALGQAAIAAARLLMATRETAPCASASPA